MSALRPDPVGRCSVRSENFNDLYDVVLLADDSTVNDEPVSLAGVHQQLLCREGVAVGRSEPRNTPFPSDACDIQLLCPFRPQV